MKLEKFQAERENNLPTGSFEKATKPSLKPKSRNKNIYHIPSIYNKFQGRPQIPYHKRPYKQSREQQRNINKPKNSFLGYGPRQNQIRYHKTMIMTKFKNQTFLIYSLEHLRK